MANALGQIVPSEPATECRGVEVFERGLHASTLSGGYVQWSDADLDRIVANYHKFSTGKNRVNYRIPVVIGHENGQDYLKRTDLPAAGFVESLRKVNGKLVCDLTNVPESIGAAINGRRYHAISAEIFDDLYGEGPALRRVSLLGGEVPEVTTLAGIPYARYSAHSMGGRYHVFAKGAAMDRDTLDQLLLALGYSQPFLDGIDDDMAGNLYLEVQRMSGALDGPPPSPDAPSDDAAPTPDSGPAWPTKPDGTTMGRDEVVAALVAQGQDEATVSAMSDADLLALYAQLNQPANANSRRRVVKRGKPVVLPQGVAHLHSMVQTLERRVTTATQTLARQEREAKDASLRAHCKRWVDERYVTPAEVDPESGNENVYHRLKRASTDRVHRFNKGGVAQSDFELGVAEIDARGANYVTRMRLGEKMPQPEGSGNPLVAAKVKAYAEKQNRLNARN